jgi:hypothetical protein
MKIALSLALLALLTSCGSMPILFNGQDLSNWHTDIPSADENPDLKRSFSVHQGMLISHGSPQGHLISNESYRDYKLCIEWRWPAKPGNCGVLVHASTPRELYGMFPRSIECQLHVNNAGDFWCIGENVSVPNMEKRRRGPKEKWTGKQGDERRIKNLTEGSELAPGEWNTMEIECRGSSIDIWVNGEHVNDGFDCTADHGQIAIQAEGAPCEFRRLELLPLGPKR